MAAVRVLLSLLTLLYSEERYIGVEAADTMQMTFIYRSKERASWTTAHRTCINLYGEMFNPKTKTLMEVLKVAIDLDETWIGLSNQGGSNPDWRWSDCEPLGSTTDWSPREPNEGKKCVVAEKWRGRWKTENCDDEFSGFVCANTEGKCYYDVHVNRVCEAETGVTVRRIVGLEKSSLCQRACSRETEGGEVCWGAEWDSGEVCTLIFSYNPFVCEETDLKMRTTLFVRKCFTFEVINDKDTTNADVTPPLLGCSADMSTEITATTTTSTSNQTFSPLHIFTAEHNSSVYNQHSVVTSDVILTSADVINEAEKGVDSTSVSWLSSISPTPSLRATSPPDIIPSESSLKDYTTAMTLSTQPGASDGGSTGCRCICVDDLRSMAGSLDIKQLQLKKKKLSSWRRKLDSAVDNRPSAQSLGASGIALLVLMFGFIILLDANRLFKQ